MAMTAAVLQKQEQILAQMGMANPFVSPTQYRNALGRFHRGRRVQGHERGSSVRITPGDGTADVATATTRSEPRHGRHHAGEPRRRLRIDRAKALNGIEIAKGQGAPDSTGARESRRPTATQDGRVPSRGATESRQGRRTDYRQRGDTGTERNPNGRSLDLTDEFSMGVVEEQRLLHVSNIFRQYEMRTWAVRRERERLKLKGLEEFIASIKSMAMQKEIDKKRWKVF